MSGPVSSQHGGGFPPTPREPFGGLNGVDSTRNPIQSESAFLMRGSSGTAEDAARKKKPEGDVRSVGEKSTSIDIWLEFMTLFPVRMKSALSCCLTLLLFILGIVLLVLSDEPKVQCLGSRAGEPTCAVMNTIVLVTIFLLALGAAGIATPRTRNALLKRMPWFTSSAWVSAMFWLVVRHVDSWTRPVAPLVALGRRGHLVMTGSPWRHVELALTCAVGVAFTVVALSDDQSPEWRPIVMAAIAHMLAGSILLGSHWHYLGTLYQRYTHVHFAAALVLTVVLYVLALSASIIMLRPRWAVGVYYRTTCPKRGNVITPVGWLGSLILRVDPSLATLKNATAVAFYGSVLAFCICALMNLDVHATTSLGVIVSVVFVMRHTKQRHVMVAADAADDALTPNVTHELLRRAFDFGMHPALRQSHGAALARPTAVVTQSFNPKLKDSSRLHKSSANDGFTRMTGRVTNVADVSSFEQDIWTKAIAQVSHCQLPYIREVEEVSIVFTDIVGFTHMSSALKPSLVLGMLQEYFTKLDVLLGMTKCFKYQTVGDAYIVLAGYDRTDPEHATTALRTAQAMIHVARSVQVPEEELVTSCAEPSGRNGVLKSMSKVDLTEHDDMPSEGDRKSGGSGGQLPTKVSPHSAEHRQEPSKRCLQIRVGIHTGPLSASTLGFRRNALTLVGDTLNVAARMESNSRPCHIRVSDATYRKLTPFVKNTFVHETLQIKGKGNMLTHIVRVDDLPHF